MRLARAPEAVAGHPVARASTPGSAALHGATRRALRRHYCRRRARAPRARALPRRGLLSRRLQPAPVRPKPKPMNSASLEAARLGPRGGGRGPSGQVRSRRSTTRSASPARPSLLLLTYYETYYNGRNYYYCVCQIGFGIGFGESCGSLEHPRRWRGIQWPGPLPLGVPSCTGATRRALRGCRSRAGGHHAAKGGQRRRDRAVGPSKTEGSFMSSHV